MQPNTLPQPSRTRAELARELRSLRRTIRREQQELLDTWESQLKRREFLPSAANLAAYIILRRQDLRELQQRLTNFGLSSLGRSEDHVLPALDTVIQALDLMDGQAIDDTKLERLARDMLHESLLTRNTARLLGTVAAGGSVHIMVTLPSEAAQDSNFVRELIVRGMGCARINCAHDDAALWEAMVAQVRAAARALDRPCQVLMDLAGPRVRTGPMQPGPSVLHVKPKRDEMGRIISNASLLLNDSGLPGVAARRDVLGRHSPAHVSVDAQWLANVEPGDTIELVDARGRLRRLQVRAHLSPHEVLVDAEAGFYVTSDTRLIRLPNEQDPKPLETLCGPIHPVACDILVCEGDELYLTRALLPGAPAANGAIAHIACQPAQVFEDLKAGDAVFIDEGRIAARIETLDADGALLRILHTRPGGDRIRSDKGVNFPDTELNLPALTEKDLRDLDFVARHADLVGYSFVQSGADMDRLIEALAQRDCPNLGIIAKIETQRAVRNLPDILVHGAGHRPLGVMIARGDLAVEIGYERLAEIQEEILWLCEAAHLPVIWATQVLEGLVKRGFPSRAEITDAAMAERAECIMINKGPFVLDAIAMLNNVVERMQAHQRKKTSRMRALHW